MTKERIAVAVVCLGGCVGVAAPWVTWEDGGASGAALVEGYFVAAGFVAALLAGLVGRAPVFARSRRIAIGTIGAAAAIYAFYKVREIRSGHLRITGELRELEQFGLDAMVQREADVGIGLYVVIVAALLLVGMAALGQRIWVPKPRGL